MLFWRREAVSKHKYKSNITCQMWLMLGKKTRVGVRVSSLAAEEDIFKAVVREGANSTGAKHSRRWECVAGHGWERIFQREKRAQDT